MITRPSFSRLFAITVGLLSASSTPLTVTAQEVLPREEAMKYAFVAALHEPATQAAPIQVDADLKRPFVGYEGDYGVLALPETKLSAASLQSAASKVIPVGQLWLRKLTPMVRGSAVDTYELQMVDIRHEGEALRVPLCLLGTRKTDAGGLELLVYGKGKEPLLAVPLKKSTRSQSLPIEITGEREYDSGLLKVHVLGQYQAEIPVTELAD